MLVREAAQRAQLRLAPTQDGVAIWHDGRVVLMAPSVGDLVAQAAKLGEASPLQLSEATAVTIDLADADRGRVLHALSPDSVGEELLERAYEEVTEAGTELCDIEALSPKVSVNGRSWGWVPLEDGGCSWGLVPARPSETLLDAALGFDGPSMVGGATEVGIRAWRNEAAVTWCRGETTETVIATEYDVPDLVDLLVRCLSWLPPDSDPICLGCDGANWGLRIEAAPVFTLETIGRAMAGVFRLCADHGSATVSDVAGWDWYWANEAWLPR